MGYYICSCSKEKQVLCNTNRPYRIHLCNKAKYIKDDGDRAFDKAIDKDIRSNYFPNGDQFWR